MNWQHRDRSRVLDVLTHMENQALAKRIGNCHEGTCHKCGDVCPLKANRWLESVGPSLFAAMQKSPTPVFQIRFSKPSWTRSTGELDATPLELLDAARIRNNEDVRVSQQAIEKAVRRSLDKLMMPTVVAVGMIDAWLGYERWEVGVTLLVAGAEEATLSNSFVHGTLKLKPVGSIEQAWTALMRESRQPKRLPPIDAIMDVPRARQREYFRWLAAMEHNHRLFRYGYDRYFNPIPKQPRIFKGTVSRTPKWRHLIPYQFGNRPPR